MGVFIQSIVGGDYSDNIEGATDFTENWRYISTGADRNPIAIRNAIPVAKGSQHPDAPTAYCLDRRVRSGGSCKWQGQAAVQWDVDLHWGRLEPTLRDGDINPLEVPAKWSFDGENFDKIMYEDFQGNPLVNSAGDYFDPPITRPQVRGILKARKAFAIDDPRASVPNLLASANKINADQVGYYPAKTLKSAVISLPEPTYNQAYDFEYYEITFAFLFNPDTWEEEYYDIGYRKLRDGKPVRILDATGQDVRQPAFLDGNGGEIATPVEEVKTLPFVLEQSVSFGSVFEFLGSNWRNV